jgi:hypothetical protein
MSCEYGGQYLCIIYNIGSKICYGNLCLKSPDLYWQLVAVFHRVEKE